MKSELQDLVQEIQCAKGMIPADLLIRNVRLVDVYTNEIYPASIAVFHGKIAAVNPPEGLVALQTLDGGGKYAVPGLIDSHIHIETTLLTPEALAEVITPWGTTSLCVDAMEIANVAGVRGLKGLLRDTENLPFHIFVEIPSRVPTAPGLETAGAEINLAETEELLEWPETLSLGELDPSKVLDIREPYLEKILAALRSGRICNGHAIGLSAEELNVYACAHLTDDHECVTFEELRDRLRKGISVFIREGSSERNAYRLLKGVIEHKLPTENLMFCTDDKHVNDIAKEGHISSNVQIAIDLGMDPVEAIKIATINAARHFHADHMIGSLTPGRSADILLLDDLKKIQPAMVIVKGVIAAEDGRAAAIPVKAYEPELCDTVHLSADFSPEKFAIHAQGKEVRCHVIRLIADQIINEDTLEWMPTRDGRVEADPERDILKLSVVERYGKNGRVSNAFVKGFTLNHGALASSVSHDHHNIVVVGTNDRDMYLAAKKLEEMKGGFAAFDNGKLVDALALPLGGLMSLKDARTVMAAMDRLNASVRPLGVTMASPFMSLSFISLPTVPELGLTDYGLIKVLEHRIIELQTEVR